MISALRRLLLAAACCGLVVQAAAHGLDSEVEALANDLPVVIVNEREYTAGELKLLLAIRVAPYIRGEYLFFGVADLVNTGFQDPGYRAIAEEARAEGVRLTGEQEEQIEREARQVARRALYRREVLDRITPPTNEELEELYEELKDTHLRLEERLVVREIHIPVESENFEETAADRAEQAWRRLEEGADFAAVMEEYNPPGMLPAPRMIVPSLEDEASAHIARVFHDLENREYSRPFRTERGYHLIQRQLYMGPGLVPLESAREFLEERHRIKETRGRIEAFFRPMVEDPALFRPHVTNLQSTGALALDDDVVARVEGRPLTRKAVTNSLGWRFSREIAHSAEYFLEMAVHSGAVQDALLDHLIDRDGLLDTPEISFQREAAEVTHLVHNYMEGLYDPEEHPVGREEIGGYFRSNRETFPAPPLLWGKELEISVPGIDSATLSEPGGALADLEEFLEGLHEIEGVEPVVVERRLLEGMPITALDEELQGFARMLPSGGGVHLEVLDETGRALIINRWEGLDYPLPKDEAVIRSYLEIEKFHRFVEDEVLLRSPETVMEPLIDY